MFMGNIKRIIMSIILIIISASLIYTGIYFSNLSKPSVILGKSFKRVGTKLNHYLSNFEELNLQDTFTLNSNITFKLDSEYYRNNSLQSLENSKKNNIINNLNKLDTDLTIKSDKNSKKAYFSIESKIDNEEIIKSKFLIDNSTEYYLLGNIVNQYINNGTCNYFETLLESNTSKDNIIYLRDFILKSFTNNLDDSYVKTYQKQESINSINQEVNELTIQFDNKSIHKILNSILKDLKKDKKASEILNNSFKNFKKYKISDKVVFLQNKEYYMLHIYTSKFFNEPLKYELTYLNNDNKKAYIYDIDDQNNKGQFYYSENDKVLYQTEINYKENSINSKIKNSGGRELGTLDLDKDKHSLNISYHFEQDKIREDYTYSSKYKKQEKNIYNEKTISLKKIDNNISKINGSIYMNSTISKDTKIAEDTSNAILANTLSRETKDKLNNYPMSVIERLERQ